MIQIVTQLTTRESDRSTKTVLMYHASVDGPLVDVLGHVLTHRFNAYRLTEGSSLDEHWPVSVVDPYEHMGKFEPRNAIIYDEDDGSFLVVDENRFVYNAAEWLAGKNREALNTLLGKIQ